MCLFEQVELDIFISPKKNILVFIAVLPVLLCLPLCGTLCRFRHLTFKNGFNALQRRVGGNYWHSEFMTYISEQVYYLNVVFYYPYGWVALGANPSKVDIDAVVACGIEQHRYHYPNFYG